MSYTGSRSVARCTHNELACSRRQLDAPLRVPVSGRFFSFLCSVDVKHNFPQDAAAGGLHRFRAITGSDGQLLQENSCTSGGSLDQSVWLASGKILVLWASDTSLVCDDVAGSSATSHLVECVSPADRRFFTY